MEIINEISKIIEWYSKHSSSASINALLDYRDKLTAFLYNLVEEVAEAKRIYNYKYYIRKITISKKKNAYMLQGNAATKSESIATEEAAAELENELNQESYALKLDLLLKQANRVVDAMAQRVSHLKTEYSHSLMQEQT